MIIIMIYYQNRLLMLVVQNYHQGSSSSGILFADQGLPLMNSTIVCYQGLLLRIMVTIHHQGSLSKIIVVKDSCCWLLSRMTVKDFDLRLLTTINNQGTEDYCESSFSRIMIIVNLSIKHYLWWLPPRIFVKEYCRWFPSWFNLKWYCWGYWKWGLLLRLIAKDYHCWGFLSLFSMIDLKNYW